MVAESNGNKETDTKIKEREWKKHGETRDQIKLQKLTPYTWIHPKLKVKIYIKVCDLLCNIKLAKKK